MSLSNTSAAVRRSHSAARPSTRSAATKRSASAKRKPAQARRKSAKRQRRADTLMNTFVFAIAVFLGLCAINLIGLTDYVEQPKTQEGVTYQVGDPESFFKALGPIAEKYESTGLYPSVMLAQAALESNFGESQLSFDYNNYFGIKAHDHHRSVNLTTTEYYDGNETTIRDYFCVYSSPEDCIEDYAKLLTENENYAQAVGAKSPAIAARALQEAGYATDPAYASKLISIINEYNLTRFDPMEVPGTASSEAEGTTETTAAHSGEEAQG